MGYENVDETARREACERVKQIVKAIKAIKVKYYLNFSKISEKDQEIYQKLQANLETISESHNLHNLKVALMSEVEAKYDRRDDDMGLGNSAGPDDILQACYGAIDAGKEALSRGRITQALRCQEQLKKYMQELDQSGHMEVINYKREKFAELLQTREQVKEQTESRNNFMKSCVTTEEVVKRKQAMDIIQGLLNKSKEQAKDTQEEMITI